MGNASPPTLAVLPIFALTYLGIALGRVPGLKLNRTGIALLAAIAIMINPRDGKYGCEQRKISLNMAQQI
jgi:hypothetical protein